MNSRLIPAEPHHYDWIELRAQEAVQIAADGIEGHKALVPLSDAAITIIADGRVVAMLGLYRLSEGVYEVWMLPSIYVAEYAMLVARAAKRYIHSFIRAENPRRVQTHAIADAFHDRWMLYLGLEVEGTMRRFGVDGTDYRMWAVIQ